MVGIITNVQVAPLHKRNEHFFQGTWESADGSTYFLHILIKALSPRLLWFHLNYAWSWIIHYESKWLHVGEFSPILKSSIFQLWQSFYILCSKIVARCPWLPSRKKWPAYPELCMVSLLFVAYCIKVHKLLMEMLNQQKTLKLTVHFPF